MIAASEAYGASVGTFKAQSRRIYKCWQAMNGNAGWGGRIAAAIGFDGLRVERSGTFVAGRGNAIATALLIDTAAQIGSATANAY